MNMMKKIKAIIIDDEPHARNVINKFTLNSGKPITIVAEFGSLLDAVPFLKENEVDLVFLDIQMPKVYGYEIVNYFDMQKVNYSALQTFISSLIQTKNKDIPLSPCSQNSSMLFIVCNFHGRANVAQCIFQ